MKSVDAIYPFVGSANEGDEVKRKRRGGRRRVLRISAVVPPLCCKSGHAWDKDLMFIRDRVAWNCSDVIDEYPIDEYPMEAMIAFHKSHGGEASIMVTKVKLH
ncbi:hypothetical protein L6452_18902 [Arctium lappa]|uniref:Uncharacterized protein n=1 Tax=Arctium lappa TaxID=4217 RepID=A0ACB9B753_ARCLA|nr:hypothetical protein L6452_18902 [Arctium lappa]